jgi:hypothetical protein
MASGRPLGAKLFLEGKEVPLIGATITSAVGQASVAYVDLVPHKSIMNIKPRTRVEIFVRNYLDTEGENKANPFPYIIAWKGDVFGYNFGKTPTSRTFSLSCIDHSSYWDSCLAYFFNALQTGSGGADKASAFLEVWDVKLGGEKIIPAYLTQSSYYKTKIQAVLKDKSKDFLDGVIAIYKDIGNVNEFFRLAEEKHRISDQIVMKSSGKLNKLLAQNEGLAWFAGLPDKANGYTTLRMVIQDMMGVLFHDFVSVLFPAAVEHPDLAGVTLKIGNNVKKTIGNFIFKPNLYMMPPPACNIFFPDEYSSFQFHRNFFKEPTRLIYMPELPARGGNGSKDVYLPHVYMPDSFSAFMKGIVGTTVSSQHQGTGSFDIPKSVDLKKLGVEGSPSLDAKFAEVNYKRKTDYNFLTNEEYMKGIWLYRESMMPATSQMRQALDEYGSTKVNFTTGVARYLFYKRRFQDRSLQITSHLKMSVVPGFSVLILDDSDSDQNVIAYCTSVTHRIYATEGGYTNVQLSYARYTSEQDVASQGGTQFLTPPWFDELIFGPAPKADTTIAGKEVKALNPQGYPAQLSDFYATLLGNRGSSAITSLYAKENTIVGATRQLIASYREQKKKGSSNVMDYIAKTTAREYIKMIDYYKFFGAKTLSKNVELDKWITFSGVTFSRAGKTDQTAASIKTSVIQDYINNLKTQRGFRG